MPLYTFEVTSLIDYYTKEQIDEIVSAIVVGPSNSFDEAYFTVVENYVTLAPEFISTLISSEDLLSSLNNYYDKTDSDARYELQSNLTTNYYDKTTSDARYTPIAHNYTFNSDFTNTSGTISLTNTYALSSTLTSNYYDKTTADARYTPIAHNYTFDANFSIASGLVSLANTYALDSAVAKLTGTQTITGDNTFTGNMTVNLSEVMPLATSSSTTVTVDITVPYVALTTTADINFTASSNRSAVRTATYLIKPYASSTRNLTFNSNWVFVGTKPTSILANKTGVLTLTAMGTAETDVVAAFGMQS